MKLEGRAVTSCHDKRPKPHPTGAKKAGTATFSGDGSSVTKASDLPEPHRIADDDFENVVEAFKIPQENRLELRRFLDELVQVFAEEVSRKRSEPKRSADTDHLGKAQKALEKARVEINLASGPAARAGLRRTAGSIGAMLSPLWIKGQFPDDRLSPSLQWWPDDGSGRTPSRDPDWPVPIDTLSLNEREHFARERARELITRVLETIDAVLAKARRQIVTPKEGKKGFGGRPPLTVRRYLLANLARHWRALGRTPGGGKNSEFPAFADAVCDYIGWEGLAGDLYEAMKLQRDWP
jgi:hypothetical protein